jgi:hypothetical protein
MVAPLAAMNSSFSTEKVIHGLESGTESGTEESDA